MPTITSARRTLRQDIDRRTHRYLLSMSIRTVCLVLAVAVHGPLRWVFLAGAIVLPYVAVVLANAGREPERGPDSFFDASGVGGGELPAGGPSPAAQEPDPPTRAAPSATASPTPTTDPRPRIEGPGLRGEAAQGRP